MSWNNKEEISGYVSPYT